MSSINVFAGLGLGQRRPQQHGGCSGGGRKNHETVQVTDLVKYKTTGTSADCGCNSDQGANACTRLKRPVPVVMSVIISTVSTVTAAALMPPRHWPMRRPG